MAGALVIAGELSNGGELSAGGFARLVAATPEAVRDAAVVGPRRHSPPCHHYAFEPWFLD